jgi:hypothetical protein
LVNLLALSPLAANSLSLSRLKTAVRYASPSSSCSLSPRCPDIERNLGKKIKKICVTRIANLISEIVIGQPNVI